MSSDLTTQEARSLRILEAVIEKGQKTFIEVGNALAAIQADKLYRGKHSTFEAYCRDRWGFAKSQAYRLIECAEVVNNISSPMGDIPKPTSERQVRPLVKLPESQQADAWDTVVTECAERGEPITAKAVEAVVERFLDPDPPHGPSDEFEFEDEEPEEKPEGPEALIERAKNLPPFSCAMNFARVAITQLEAIPIKDPQREEAFDTVEKWIHSQRRKS